LLADKNRLLVTHTLHLIDLNQTDSWMLGVPQASENVLVSHNGHRPFHFSIIKVHSRIVAYDSEKPLFDKTRVLPNVEKVQLDVR
jgi:hypothetical protein